ncbi:MAG: hypothetical protein QXL15_00550 [Candidatus Korarchaeota archaeon]
MNDAVVLVLTYIYVSGVIAVSVTVKQLLKLSVEVSRKIIHVFAGQVIFLIPLFNTPAMGMITAISFLVLIYISGPNTKIKFLRKMFEGMARESEKEHIWGPFYYAISINVLVGAATIPVLFGNTFLMERFVFIGCALNAMFIGDGIAPLVVKNRGKSKTLKGSAVVFAGAFLGSFLSVLLVGTVRDYYSILIMALITATVASILERISGHYDNIIMPCGVTSILIISDLLFVLMR